MKNMFYNVLNPIIKFGVRFSFGKRKTIGYEAFLGLEIFMVEG